MNDNYTTFHVALSGRTQEVRLNGKHSLNARTARSAASIAGFSAGKGAAVSVTDGKGSTILLYADGSARHRTDNPFDL